MFETLIDILIPKYCLICFIPGKYLCLNCFKKLTSILPICPICNRLSSDYTLHSKCSKIGNINQLISLYNYNKLSRKIIKEIKYKNRTKVLDYFISISKQRIEQLFSKGIYSNSILIPIPLHKQRYLERGFNQSYLIAQLLSEITGIKVNNSLAIRLKNNKKQSEIKYKNSKLREKNTKDIFGVNSIVKATIHKDTTLILIDDVITTKSTVNSLANSLQNEGFNKIAAFSLFRAHPYKFLSNQSELVNMHTIQT